MRLAPSIEKLGCPRTPFWPSRQLCRPRLFCPSLSRRPKTQIGNGTQPISPITLRVPRLGSTAHVWAAGNRHITITTARGHATHDSSSEAIMYPFPASRLRTAIHRKLLKASSLRSAPPRAQTMQHRAAVSVSKTNRTVVQGRDWRSPVSRHYCRLIEGVSARAAPHFSSKRSRPCSYSLAQMAKADRTARPPTSSKMATMPAFP